MMEKADRSRLAQMFASALDIADHVAPLESDPSIAGACGQQATRLLRPLFDELDAIPTIADIPVEVLQALKGIARIVRGTHTDCVTFGDVAIYLLRSDLRSRAESGWQALTQTKPENRGKLAWADDPPFACGDLGDRIESAVSFLEEVRDNVRYAAEAKRQQLERGYSDATIASMVRAVNWGRAKECLAELAVLPSETIEDVARVLNRTLTSGTVERIEELISPSIRKLREVWEGARDNYDVVEEENPEVIRLQSWLQIDGIKGHWQHNITTAEYWNLEIDTRHRNIAFLIRQLIGGDPSEDVIRDYLFRVHGVLPSDEIDISKLEHTFRQDAARVRNAGSGSGESAGQPEAAVSAPGLSTSPKPNPRGRKKADYETAQREAKLAADWDQARKAGVYKGAFAKDCGMSAREFDKLLDRVAKRNRASE